jgi:hypothetical protein
MRGSPRQIGSREQRFTARIQAAVTLPQFAEDGIWTIAEFDLVDQVGNRVELGAAQIAVLGLPTSFNVSGARLTVIFSEGGLRRRWQGRHRGVPTLDG